MFISLFVPLFVIIIVTIYKLNIFLNFPPLLGAYWTDKTSLTGLTEWKADVFVCGLARLAAYADFQQ